MITIAIDPSTKCTGYSVFKNNELIDYGAFSEESKNTTERVFNILTKVEELIKKIRTNKYGSRRCTNHYECKNS